MLFWLQFLLAWFFLSVFFALIIGACIRSIREDDESTYGKDWHG
jgi:hypothetical protein